MNKQCQADGKKELLIDGSVFSEMLNSDQATLIKVNESLNRVNSVIIYRASPKQKQQVVQFIR